MKQAVEWISGILVMGCVVFMVLMAVLGDDE